ncbi:MAG: right-handed parallel beta-helix repeat-containing protein [Sphingomonadaceae bacterium]|nr:right-handed parallel beta-helix repeat-containing protein [Sphingomonadaceae bacterium]
MRTATAFAVAILLSGTAHAATIAVEAGDDAQERLQAALIEAARGDTVQIGAGRFALTDGLSLDVDRVTVRGAGPGETILDFSGQLGAGEGLLVTSDDVVLRDFAVENPRGDGIKSRRADRIVYHNLRVEWTGGPAATNGAYGLYPVESEDVLVDGCTVIGASDAGIYVGQSDRIVVRNNSVRHNVAGIEIENSFNADVHHNTATQNTGGVLVFDLPNLPQMGGHGVRVFANTIRDNNTPNFAPEGNIVATVPAGTGVIVMANRDVRVFDNDIGEHGTSNVMLISYPQSFDDASYDPSPRNVVVSGNRHGRAGYAPGRPGMAEMAAAMGGTLPPVMWDGTGEGIAVLDAVPVLSLGLTRAGQPVDEAQPSLAQFEAAPPAAELPRVTLPASMEAAIR